MPSSVPTRGHVIALIALLSLLWGSTWIVIAGGLRDLPPFTSAAARFLIAALAMSAIAPAIARREGGSRAPWKLGFVLGTLNFGASYAIVYWTETHLPSGIVSVLWAVFPMLMAASSSWFLAGETLTARQWAGFTLGFAGVALLFATDLHDFGAHGIPAAGMLLVSPIVSCIGTVVLKREGKGVSSALVNRDAMWIGAAILTTLAFAFERHASPEWTPRAIGSVVYLALAGTVLTFSLYFWLLRNTEAWRLSTISYVTPAVALLLGTFVGNEPFTRWTLAGSLTILAGVVLATFRPR
ncbi:MAG: EamA family transporter [Planctomycetota bacterium]|nr:EamA family transporter [Planctomycetota bacterium]